MWMHLCTLLCNWYSLPLDAFIFYISRPVENVDTAKLAGSEEMMRLLQSEAFWDLCTGSDQPTVRRAMHRLVRTIASSAPSLLDSEDMLELIADMFLNDCFKDNCPANHDELWPAVLVLSRGMQCVYHNVKAYCLNS